jgi:hypothetical protein
MNFERFLHRLALLSVVAMAGCATAPSDDRSDPASSVRVIRFDEYNGKYGKPGATGILHVRSPDNNATCYLEWVWRANNFPKPEPLLQFGFKHDSNGSSEYSGVPWLPEAKAGIFKPVDASFGQLFWENCTKVVMSQLDPTSLLAKDLMFIRRLSTGVH